MSVQIQSFMEGNTVSNSSIVAVGGESVIQLEKALDKSYEQYDELMAENARLKKDNRRLAILVQELRINRQRT